MNTSEQILVIFLSVFLALFLIIAVIVAVQLYKLIRTVNRIADKAEKVIDSAEMAGTVFRNAAKPLGVFKLLYGIVDSVAQHQSKKK